VNVLFDHNISFRIAHAFRELFGDQHTVVALTDKFPNNTPDVDWIKQLSQEGQWVVISGDRRITRNMAEYNAFRSSRLIGFFLSKGLGKAPVIKQAERLLVLWPGIEAISAQVGPGAVFELQMKSSRIAQLQR
jgi:hypothetical protein